MGKIDPLKNRYLTLSTGDVAEIKADTVKDAIDTVENLLSLIVEGHFEEIEEIYIQTGKNPVIHLIEAEVQHLVENELSDDLEGALKFFLMAFACEKYAFLLRKS